MRKRATRRLALAAAVTEAVIMLTQASPSFAINQSDSGFHRPTTWAPNYLQSQIQNDAKWGDNAYFMAWLDPALGRNIGKPRTDHGVFEVGWKNAPHDTAQSLDQRGKHGDLGFPSEVSVKPDWTEDDDDVVQAVLDVDYWMADIRRRRGKIYSAWSTALRKNDGWTTGGSGLSPYLQVQLGAYKGRQSVATTFSKASLNYVPQQNGAVGFPYLNTDGGSYRTETYAPWLRNPNFETGQGGWLADPNTYATRVCNPANQPEQGRCYAYFRPLTYPATRARIYQKFQVSILSKRPGRPDLYHTTGHRTGVQFEGVFRCVRSNSADCRVSISQKTASAPDYKSKSFIIPRNGKWYRTLVDQGTGFGPQANDMHLTLVIDSHGSALDADSLWVSSGL